MSKNGSLHCGFVSVVSRVPCDSKQTHVYEERLKVVEPFSWKQ